MKISNRPISIIHMGVFDTEVVKENSGTIYKDCIVQHHLAFCKVSLAPKSLFYNCKSDTNHTFYIILFKGLELRN